MTQAIETLENAWNACGKSAHDMRSAAVGVVAAMCNFARASGLSPFGKEFANHLLVALGELENGRRSEILQPEPVPSNSFSEIDLGQQGTAFACVQLLREAGLRAGEARAEVARYMERQGLPKFSTHKLRSLGTRLTGPGSESDPAFDYYQLAQGLIAQSVGEQRFGGKIHPDVARNSAQALIKVLSRQDHRRVFFSDPPPE